MAHGSPDYRKSSHVKSSRAVKLSTAAAHVLAWAVSLWLAFGPVYQGVEATPVGPDGTGGEVTRFSQSLVAANGLWVLMLLAIPVALTALGLLVVFKWNGGRAGNRLALWGLAIALLVCCGLGLFSIGLFYLPAALAMIFSASLSLLPSAKPMKEAGGG
jgi:hypothetical protein